MSLEDQFDPTFAAQLALREKQIQQNYRPIIGVHKWFARRPGTVFRTLLLAEFNGPEPLETSYWRSHAFRGVIADPFMGGGTPIYEANRLGFDVVGTDINAMAYWVVRQSLTPVGLNSLAACAKAVSTDIERTVGAFYQTQCEQCGQLADVKYFLWVKVQACPSCGIDNDLFPGYLLAEAVRHPKHVLVCAACGALNEYDRQPTVAEPEPCAECGRPVHIEGATHKHQVMCRCCSRVYRYPIEESAAPLRHRMWALEYHCAACKPHHTGRFFKRPSVDDLTRFEQARALLAELPDLLLPDNEIPAGDETDRLHRWGYRRYRDMFNERQLVGLGLLLRRIRQVSERAVRHALLTVFSDFLRYQNMLCRYDTYALKCQDIFSVHGFPVGLIQCENNLLGIPRVGSGSFRHFVEKYIRAKQYCEAPFETRQDGRRKTMVPIAGEHIAAKFVDTVPKPLREGCQALLRAMPATDLPLPPASLDGVFTDPPYFDNVQYAELMDFCFAWLRLGLSGEFTEFTGVTTRTQAELTGNTTLGRGLNHFTAGLSAVFCHYASALRLGAPFVFTYHHNDPAAYAPLVVAILDAGMCCTATLPAVAEMSASLHIAGTSSSTVDSVFVCRRATLATRENNVVLALHRDVAALRAAPMRPTAGDVRCLLAGHIARVAINQLFPTWDAKMPLAERMTRANACLIALATQVQVNTLTQQVLAHAEPTPAEQPDHDEEDTFAATV